MATNNTVGIDLGIVFTAIRETLNTIPYTRKPWGSVHREIPVMLVPETVTVESPAFVDMFHKAVEYGLRLEIDKPGEIYAIDYLDDGAN